MLILALGILCGLATAVFATLDPRPRRAAILWLAAMALALTALGFSRVPSPAWIGAGIAAAAALVMFRPHWSLIAVAAGGVAGALWVNLLVASNLPVPVAIAVVLAIAGTTFTLVSKRANFAPLALREEALVLVTVLALVVAAAPSVGSGFSAAIALKAQPLGGESIAAGSWPLILASGCILLGGIYSIWKRR